MKSNFKLHNLLSVILVIICVLQQHLVAAFSATNKFSFPSFSFGLKPPATKSVTGNLELENQLIAAIQNQGSRIAKNSNDQVIEELVRKLEDSKSLPEPAIAPQIYGKWRLIYTSNASTSSPIQRTAVGSDKFPIYQNIVLVDNNDDNNSNNNKVLMVQQIVQFSDKAQLSVDALASTPAYPLEELTSSKPRQSTGKILGLNLLGVSLVGEEALPKEPKARIDFVFDQGEFDFGNFKLPYPVPFRLPILRDWVKGWIDITYLSDTMRISRGNKGTTFVLIKEDDASSNSNSK